MASERRSKVPASTSCWASASYSSADPSHQWIASGLVSSATCSTHARSFSCLVGTVVWLTWCVNSQVRGRAGHCGAPPPGPPHQIDGDQGIRPDDRITPLVRTRRTCRARSVSIPQRSDSASTSSRPRPPVAVGGGAGRMVASSRRGRDRRPRRASWSHRSPPAPGSLRAAGPAWTMLLVTSSLTSSSASGSLPASNIPAECSARRADPAARGIGSRNNSMATPGDASIQGWTYPFGQLPTQFSGLFDVAAGPSTAWPARRPRAGVRGRAA